MKIIFVLLVAFYGVSWKFDFEAEFSSHFSPFQSLALDEAQVLHLQELNQSFDIIHKNFDFRINNAIRNTTAELKVLQAQMISRLGFVTDEINVKREETQTAIDERSSNVEEGNECIADLQISLDNAVEYAGSSVSMLVHEVMYYINQIERDYFYPYIGILQRESNILQWMVMSEIQRHNPVTGIERFIEVLELDLYIVRALYTSAITQIPAEMVRLHDHMDEVKEFYFPQLNSHRDYFRFTADVIKDSLPLC